MSDSKPTPLDADKEHQRDILKEIDEQVRYLHTDTVLGAVETIGYEMLMDDIKAYASSRVRAFAEELKGKSTGVATKDGRIIMVVHADVIDRALALITEGEGEECRIKTI